MSTNDAEVRFGGDVGDLISAMETAKEAVSSSMEGMTHAIEGVMGKYTEFLAVLAGGAAFKEAISSFMEMAAETTKLMYALGIDAEEAAGLSQALEEVGSSGDEYAAAFTRFNRVVKTHSEQLQSLGVDVKGFQEGQVTSRELFQQALQKVNEYDAGINRTQASMELFGARAGNLGKLMKVNNDAIKEATKEAKALGLVYTEADMEMKAAFTKMKANAGDAFDGIQKAMAVTVMPTLIEMGNEFAKLGPVLVDIARILMTGLKIALDGVWMALKAAFDVVGDVISDLGKLFGLVTGSLTPMQFFQNVVAVLAASFLALGTAVNITIGFVKLFATEILPVLTGVFSTIQGIVLGIYNLLAGVGFAFADALTGDFTRSKSYFAKAWDSVKDPVKKAAGEVTGIWSDGMKDLEDRSKKAQDKIKSILMGDAFSKSNSPAAVPGGGHGTWTPPGKPGDEMGAYKIQKAALEAELALLKEKDKEMMAVLDDDYKHNLISEEQYWQAKETIQRNELNKELELKRQESAELDKQIASVKSKKANDPQAENKRNALRAQQITLQGQIDVLLQKEADLGSTITRQLDEANRKRLEALTTIEIQRAQDVGHDRVAEEQAQNDQLKALRQIDDATAIANKRKFTDEMYNIDLQAANDRLEIAKMDGDPAKIEEAHSKIQQLERTHQKQLSDIDREATLERSKYNIEFMSSLESSFTSLFQNLAQGQKTLKATLLDFVSSISSAISRIYAEMLAKQIVGGMGGAGGGGLNLGGMFSGLASFLPKFDVGTPYVPQDMMAVVHKGEAIIPAAQNKGGSGGINVSMNISTPNADSFRASQAQIMAQLNMALAAGRRIT